MVTSVQCLPERIFVHYQFQMLNFRRLNWTIYGLEFFQTMHTTSYAAAVIPSISCVIDALFKSSHLLTTRQMAAPVTNHRSSSMQLSETMESLSLRNLTVSNRNALIFYI